MCWIVSLWLKYCGCGYLKGIMVYCKTNTTKTITTSINYLRMSKLEKLFGFTLKKEFKFSKINFLRNITNNVPWFIRNENIYKALQIIEIADHICALSKNVHNSIRKSTGSHYKHFFFFYSITTSIYLRHSNDV